MGNCMLHAALFVTILLCMATVLDVRAGVLVGEADGGPLPAPLRRRHRRTSGEYIITANPTFDRLYNVAHSVGSKVR